MINSSGGIERFIGGEIDFDDIRPFSFVYDERENFLSLICSYRKKITLRPKSYKYGNTLIFYLKFFNCKRSSIIIDESNDDSFISFHKIDEKMNQITSVGRIQINIIYDFCSASISK